MGRPGYGGDGGPATAASLKDPHNLAETADGGFLIADTSNQRIRKVWPDGTITTVAGSSTSGYAGDGGPPTQAQLSAPKAVADTAADEFLIADESNNRVRFVGVVYAATNTALPTVSGTPRHNETLTASAGSWTGTQPISYAYRWRRCDSGGGACADVAGATAESYVAQSADVGSTLRVQVTATNAGGSTVATSDASAAVTAAAPTSNALPTVTGTAQQGETLTGSNGTWNGTSPFSYTYQWQRCNTSGTGCVDVFAATGTTYALSVSDVGSTMRITVTASNSAGASTASSVATPVVVSNSTPPANTAPPAVSGTAEAGQTLSASPGSWSGTVPLTHTYQWRRCDGAGAACGDVAGATGSTYVLAAADVGSTLRVVVTAMNSSGSASSTSSPSAVVVVASPPSTLVAFGVSAGGDDGDLLARSGAYPPSVSPNVNTSGGIFTAGRRLFGTNYDVIVGLLRFDTSSLPDDATVTSAKLRVYVNKKSDGNNRNLVGGWYAGSNWPIDVADYALESSADALEGADVTGLSVGSVNEFTLSGLGSVSRTGYSGLRLHIDGGVPTADNYVQFASFDHATLPEPQLVVTYTAGAAPSAPANTVLPAVSGSAQEGQTLSATTGTWSNSPTGYAYQWRRCDSSGAGCVDLAGATGSTYALVAADVGSTIRVRLTASNAGGSASASSDQTAVVAAAGPPSTLVAFGVSAGGDDGDLLARSGAYPPSVSPNVNTSGGIFTAGRRLFGTNYDVIVGLLRFDTSSLPDDATVTSAKLRVYVNKKSDGNNRNLVGGWYAGSNWPIDVADYALESSADALEGADVTGLSVGSVNEFTLSGLGSVSRTGYSGLRLHIDGGVPTADNYVQFASFDHATLPEPQLVVTYTAGAAPSAPANTVLPAVSGSAQEGQTLSATTGTWSNSPTGYAYQWRRCDSSGAGCVDLAGATGSTYALVAADVGSTIRVRLTASNAGGSASASSDQTAVVAAAGRRRRWWRSVCRRVGMMVICWRGRVRIRLRCRRM